LERRLDGSGLTVTEINRALRDQPDDDWTLSAPDGRHNIGVAVVGSGSLRIEGNVGAYCAGMNNGLDVHVDGSAGWGLAENNEGGTVVVEGSAGAGAGASMRAGAVAVRGDADVRAGVSMKGGLLAIGGSAGAMCGFMHQRGTIVICGDAHRGVGDSMYEGVVLVGGEIAEPGNDTRLEKPDADDERVLAEVARLLGNGSLDRDWKKLVAARRLWYFTKENMAMWREM
jgi:methylamine---glutamate N-methyltransferase subunit B